MSKKSLWTKVVLGLALGIPLIFAGSSAMADNHEERHYYRDGGWYRHDEGGHDVSVADLVVGAIADSLPPQHTTVVYQNTPYYYDNHHYYRQRSEGGYVVVEEPRR